MRCVPGVGLYFSSLSWLRGTFCDGTPGPLQAMMLGAAARTLTGVTMIPITVIKTRYEVRKRKGNRRRKRSNRQWAWLYKEEEGNRRR